MSDLVHVSTAAGIAIIVIDNPPVNALSAEVAEQISAALDSIERGDQNIPPAGVIPRGGQNTAAPEASAHGLPVDAVVIMGAGKTFIAGADIAGLERAAWGDPAQAIDLHPLLARVEDFSRTIVMAVHGTALGGGLELAMAGHYRIATADALLGQPEVNLGIIPGAEGTQRLPRLVGVAKALDMCVTGKPLTAADALAAGLVDAVVGADLSSAAVTAARRQVAGGAVTRTRDLGARLATAAEQAPLFAAARALAAKTRRGQAAPLAAIEAIAAAASLPFEAGCRREREIFLECVGGEQAKAMIHLFFAERATARVTGVTTAHVPRPIATVAVVGAGTMGAGIAAACANAGMTVLLKDTSEAALDAGLDSLRRIYDSAIARGRLTPETAATRLADIRRQLSYDGFEQADVIVEAVFERMDLKQQVFREIAAVAKPSAVLATNTSTLDVDALAAVTGRAADTVGLHFFSPAQVMRLLEVVRGAATSPEVLATALAFARRLGKIAVTVGNGQGFVGNRMMFPYMYEAQLLLEEGATPQQVDRALTSFGMAMGIFAVEDMAGIDVAWRIRQEVGQRTPRGARQPLVADRLYALGRLGQKSGAGWYAYDDQRRPLPDQLVLDLIRQTAAAAGIPQRRFTDAEIVERCIYALVNEGARVLADGAAERAADIDVIYCNGYGFPGWRGGPMFYADRTGLAAIHARITTFHREHGERWAPAPLLAQLAAEGVTFRERDRARGNDS